MVSLLMRTRYDWVLGLAVFGVTFGCTAAGLQTHRPVVDKGVNTSATDCPASALQADVVAIDHPMLFNRLGAQNINWMMYALRHDVLDLKSRHIFDYTPEGERLFRLAAANNKSRDIALRPDLRPRPLVLRVAAGGYLKVRFTNLLEIPSNPFASDKDPLPGIEHPMDKGAKDPAGTPGDKRIYQIDDQVASRTVGFHPQGLELAGSIASDSSFTGKNASSLAAPGETKDYCFYAPHEGSFLVGNDGAVFGGEGTAGDSGVGLFGAVTVQPKKARFYRAQLTEEEMRLATVKKTPMGQPVINYEATYPNDCAAHGIWCKEGKAGRTIINMVQNNRIMHGDINAIIVGPNEDGSFPPGTYDTPGNSKNWQNPAMPNRLEPFREFVSIFHDENAVTQVFPYFFEHPELRHTLHGVRDGFMINYGSGGVGAEIVANRLKVGPMQDCIDCAYEEFFLAAAAVGDPAMLVDKPANLIVGQCQPEYLTDKKFAAQKEKYCTPRRDMQASEAFYPHDPANVHHSYIGDFVKFRNMHAGKEQHIFHLHNHQWLFSPNDDNSNYIDAQGIAPGSGYTYEIAFGGSGNRNKTVGDAIFHCHFYPHFAQGMWYLWRNHDVFEAGTRLAVSDTKTGFHDVPYDLMSGKPSADSRALPDGELVAGAPIPAIVPLPGKGLALMPAEVKVKPRVVDGVAYGSVAQVIKRTSNPGYPFWIAGIETSVGARPPTPPLDMGSIPGVVAGNDGGLPRHALGGYAADGLDKWDPSNMRLSLDKEVMRAKPVYFPEAGTDLEKVAMDFHSVRDHATHKVNMAGAVSAASFVTNGAPPVPGAPYNDPCIDDKGKRLITGGDGDFFGGEIGKFFSVKSQPWTPGGIEFGGDKPRVYKGANVQLDVVFNKVGYHYPQQRILSLWEDVKDLLDKKNPKAPEPLVIRMNTFDCAMYAHTNLVPKKFYADDYQITTPTDIIGQHIHLPKWDLTTGDGSGNGWNYEDGTLSPGAVRERIAAINAWNQKQAAAGKPVVPKPDGTTTPLVPTAHPYFGSLGGDLQKSPDQCARLWNAAGGDIEKFEHDSGIAGVCDWLGARTTLQRWFSDPIVNAKLEHRGLGITFTHDHFGPSTHQQTGLYATMLSEPPGSLWRHNETGAKLYDTATRNDGGPTSWQAVITGKNGKAIDLDNDKKDDAHREFFLQFGDFQHAYVKDKYVGVNKDRISSEIDPSVEPNKDSFRYAIHPPLRKPVSTAGSPDILEFRPDCPGGANEIRLPGAVYNVTNAPARPCPEAIAADDVGMMVVNYRNEPIGLRVYDPNKTGPDGKKGDQANGLGGDLAYAMSTRTDRAIPEMNSVLGNTPYAPLTHHVLPGDPFTPIMRAYAGDMVRVKIQAGAHEHEHNGTINNLAWLQAGSGYGNAPNSGWRNAQNTGLSEQFTFGARITDYESRWQLNDRLYAIDTSQDGLWSGVWGVMRGSNRRGTHDELVTLPSNPLPTLLAPNQGNGRFNDCPSKAPIRRYYVSAVLANKVLPNALGVTIPPAAPGYTLDAKGGTLVYNPRDTKIKINVVDENGKIQRVEEFGSGPLHDPTAILFARDEDLDRDGKIKPGVPVEPIVLRAAAGECVQVVLHNRLPEQSSRMPDLYGYTSLSAIVRRDLGLPSSSMTSFNNNLLRPSNHIGLHPQLVHYDVQGFDGNNVGMNKISTVAPGATKLYQWYAGVVDTAPSSANCAAVEPVRGSDEQNRYFDELNEVIANEDLRPLSEVISALKADALKARLVGDLANDITFPGSSERLAEDLPTDSTAFFDRSAVLKRRIERVENLRYGIDILWEQIEALRKQGVNLALDDPNTIAETLTKLTVEHQYAKDAAYLGDAEIDKEVRKRIEDSLIGMRKEGADYLDNLKLSPRTTRLVKVSRKDCNYTGVEFGGSNLTPPDRIKQGQKAAIGAMVIEPKDARWEENADDTAIDRQNPGTGQVNKRATRATATVLYPVDAKGNGNKEQRSFRDLVMVHQKGLNLRYKDGKPVANLAAEKNNPQELPADTAPEDAHDSGHMAINYGAEPMWFRFGLPPDANFNRTGFGGVTHAWQAFSNSCCDNGGTAISADKNVGEPYVPVMTVPPGSEMRVRAVLPTGSGRASTVELHGHMWPRAPYLAEQVDSAGFPTGGVASQCIGGGQFWPDEGGSNGTNFWLGGQESVSPMAHYDMVFRSAGGRNRIPGDYLWRDHAGFGITNGLWAVVRVEGQPVNGVSPPLRMSCR